MNYEGVLTIEAASTGQASTLAGIAALVAEAQVLYCHCLCLALRTPIC